MMWKIISAALILLFATIAWTAFAADTEPSTPKLSVEVKEEPKEPTDLVAAFYEALLQKDPPTMEQERALFDTGSSELRLYLIKKNKLPADKPVVLIFLREHKELFVPKNPGGAEIKGWIQLTSPFQFVRSLARKKEGQLSIRVLAHFVEDATAKEPRFRFVSFTLNQKSHKIEADNIYIDGIFEHSLEELFVWGQEKGQGHQGN